MKSFDLYHIFKNSDLSRTIFYLSAHNFIFMIDFSRAELTGEIEEFEISFGFDN